MDRLIKLHHGELETMDIFEGGMLETTPSGPGDLFTNILMDQLIRIRDGDRFWFENTETGIFTRAEMDQIRQVTLSQIIVNTTGVEMMEIQDDVFTLNSGDPCPQEMQLRENILAPCPEHIGYDFFAGSEVPYIIIWTCLGLIPIGM
ncbi:dual oxidase-like [Gigantopelta aegis]|uniref:dual oxidase-like n=1 Tax=Gigantopelta aegis TaxID=1735272 RepID=UPI001B888563|nr:dual oxidase-like [Gigantopelta aegis]